MRRANRLLAAGLLVGLLPLTAIAEPLRGAKHLEASRSARESVPLPFPAPQWLRTNLHVHRKAGLEYRRSLRLGESDYTVGVRGPVISRKRMSFGLTLQVRF